MKLKEFKKLHKRFSKLPLSKRESESNDYRLYDESLNNDNKSGVWYIKQVLKDRKFNYKKYCCLSMAYHLSMISSEKGNRLNSDVVIKYSKQSKTYGLPVHDGGSSVIEINFCPWCGKKL